MHHLGQRSHKASGRIDAKENRIVSVASFGLASVNSRRKQNQSMTSVVCRGTRLRQDNIEVAECDRNVKSNIRVVLNHHAFGSFTVDRAVVKEVISNESGSDPWQWLLGVAWVESRPTSESTSAALENIRILQIQAPQPGLAVIGHPVHTYTLKKEKKGLQLTSHECSVPRFA